MQKLASISIVAALTTGAYAGIDGQLMSFNFAQLEGTYDGTNFTTVAGTASSGTVARLTGPGGSATFEPNFINAGGFGNVVVDLVVTVDEDGPGNIAQGVGTLLLTDVDGDTIAAEIYGAFLGSGDGDYFFDGFLYDVTLTSDDGQFHGSSGAANLPGGGPYEGIFVEISFAAGTGFFDSAFTSNVLATGIIIPAPGSAALLGLGGLLVARRRRCHSPGM